MIIGKAITVGGNGGIPCTLVIATAPGATVTATLNGITISTTANSSGVATFELKKEGTWTVTAEQNGLSDSTNIVVEHTFHVTLYLMAPLYIYTSGDLTFQNCTWTDPDDVYVRFPTQIPQDYMELEYEANGGTTVGSFSLRVGAKSKGYRKLYVEVQRMGVGGMVDKNYVGVSFNNGTSDAVNLNVGSKDVVLCEFDIPNQSQINAITFGLEDDHDVRVYNIWIE